MEHCASCSTNPETRKRADFVGSLPIPGFSPDPWAKWDVRVEATRIDPLNDKVVEELSDGLQESASEHSVKDTEWQSPVTVRPELFWVQRHIAGEWRWREATRPSHFSQFVSTHRVDVDEQGWRNEGGEFAALLPEWELEQLSAMPNYSLTESLTRL